MHITNKWYGFFLAQYKGGGGHTHTKQTKSYHLSKQFLFQLFFACLQTLQVKRVGHLSLIYMEGMKFLFPRPLVVFILYFYIFLHTKKIKLKKKKENKSPCRSNHTI